MLALGILTLIYTVFNTIEHCFGYFMKGEDLPDGIILGAYVSIFKKGEDMHTIIYIFSLEIGNNGNVSFSACVGAALLGLTRGCIEC